MFAMQPINIQYIEIKIVQKYSIEQNTKLGHPFEFTGDSMSDIIIQKYGQ